MHLICSPFSSWSFSHGFCLSKMLLKLSLNYKRSFLFIWGFSFLTRNSESDVKDRSYFVLIFDSSCCADITSLNSHNSAGWKLLAPFCRSRDSGMNRLAHPVSVAFGHQCLDSCWSLTLSPQPECLLPVFTYTISVRCYDHCFWKTMWYYLHQSLLNNCTVWAIQKVWINGILWFSTLAVFVPITVST